MLHEEASLLPPGELNQKEGYVQSLENWSIVHEGDNYFVENTTDRNLRFKAPNADNFVEGVVHPSFVRQGTWELLRQNMAHRPSDIWVATFPKCGTTLMEQVILLLLNNGDPGRLDPRSKNKFSDKTGIGKVWPESDLAIEVNGKDSRLEGRSSDPHGLDGGGKGKGKDKGKMTLQEFERIEGARLLKTHAPRQLFLATRPVEPASFSASGRPAPLLPDTKVIYVCRNAKDACVSSYYHAANPKKMGIPFDAWVKIWLSGLFEHGRWSDHVAGWRSESTSNPEQVLWVRYEDMLAQPEKEIRRVASFLGLAVSDEAVTATVLHSGFEKMKAQSGDADHMRKGVVGDSERHFSPQLSKEFDLLYKEMMRGVDDPYSQRGMKRSLQ
eukprot:TRINITY_DN6453_c0_g1_i1.p1 TRINITY_DN6453_c0_g1~~TRINITY_DN6453_c0_g1_i1.p1  ORF type:complete len:399 (-),score=75.42 TRINITY_DN6453_c0_g1_i1:144-1295(-)